MVMVYVGTHFGIVLNKIWLCVSGKRRGIQNIATILMVIVDWVKFVV